MEKLPKTQIFFAINDCPRFSQDLGSYVRIVSKMNVQ